VNGGLVICLPFDANIILIATIKLGDLVAWARLIARVPWVLTKVATNFEKCALDTAEKELE
jgi:hypothetical protein